MKPEEQRIAIAEACGWNFHPPCYNEGPFSTEFKAEALACWVRPGNMPHQTEYPPDYLNDLNAMHEAEKVLMIHHPVSTDDGMKCALVVHATASQRAEAFLRTLNLYIP